MKLFSGALFLALALLAGCGGKVVVDQPGSGGGTTTGTVTTGTTTAVICGGKLGTTCAADEYCKWDASTPCGNADGTGVCTAKPTGCPADCPVACGCDGNVYCNACLAQQAGVDTDPNAACGLGGGTEYHAFILPTDAPRYAILKIDNANDRCTVMTVAATGQSSFGIQTTAGWGVEWVWMTPSAAYCQNLAANAYPELPATYAKSLHGMGSLKQDNVSFPCTLDLSFTLLFDGTQPWAPATDDWLAAGLIVDGGCYD
jgi:hypothetical protein